MTRSGSQGNKQQTLELIILSENSKRSKGKWDSSSLPSWALICTLTVSNYSLTILNELRYSLRRTTSEIGVHNRHKSPSVSFRWSPLYIVADTSLASGLYYDLKARRTRALSFQCLETVGNAVHLLIHDKGTEQFEKNDWIHVVKCEIISAMTDIIILPITAGCYIIICRCPSSTAQKRWISPTTLYLSRMYWVTGFGFTSAPLQQTLVQTGTFRQYVIMG